MADSMSFRANKGLEFAIADFKAYKEVAPKKIGAQLTLLLEQGYRATRETVHVDTSSLKNSGRGYYEDGLSTKPYKWEGTVSYGGPSTGIKNPVKYAKYERARGGSHDFMHPLILTEQRMEKAIRNMLTDNMRKKLM